MFSRARSTTVPGPAAFTLIELLVVISIISLLIAILLPSLAAARKAAQAAACGSNIRQLAIANTTYSVDHRDHYVAASYDYLPADWSDGDYQRWHGYRDNQADPFDPSRGPLWPYLQTEQIKECPTLKSSEMAASFEAGCGGYGYNQTYVGNGNDDVTVWNSPVGARSSRFAHPSDTVMFTDSAFLDTTAPFPYIEYSFAEPPQNAWSWDNSPSIHFRHSRTANVAWVDGHVSRPKIEFSHDYWFGIVAADALKLDMGWFGQNNNDLFDRE